MPLSPQPFLPALTEVDLPDGPIPAAAARRSTLAALLAGGGAFALGGCASHPPAAVPARAAAPLGAPSTSEPPPWGVEEVPYVQTPQTVVDAMLGLAAVHSGDRLIDLGSGDGRVVIAAARQFGIDGLGVELDPQLVELSRQRAREAGVESLARFAAQDLFETDLSAATVITLYLLPDVNLALRPRLLRLAPGTRIVSHDWDMAEWRADRRLTVPAPGKPVGRRQESVLMLWIVPAPVGGSWRGDVDSAPSAGLSLRIRQQFQDIVIEWQLEPTPGSELPVRAQARTRLAGDRASFVVAGPSREFPVSLRWRAGQLEGSISTPTGPLAWRAKAA